jgi:hypothetical protein
MILPPAPDQELTIIMLTICWLNLRRPSPIEFDLPLELRRVFRTLSLPGTQRLELLVAL